MIRCLDYPFFVNLGHIKRAFSRHGFLRMKTKLLLILFFLFHFSLIKAEGLRFEKILSEQGIVSNRIYASIRDYKGNVWLAAVEGVSRYDGKKSTNYSFRSDSTKHHVSGLRFYRIVEDLEKHIWLGADTGLKLYDEEQDSFRDIPFVDNQKRKVDRIIIRPDGDLLIVSNKNIYRVIKDENSWLVSPSTETSLCGKIAPDGSWWEMDRS